MPLKPSWINSANCADHPFPLNNLPYGVFDVMDDDPRCGVAIGDVILDLRAAEEHGLIVLGDEPLMADPFWNGVMEQGPAVWTALRNRLMDLLGRDASSQQQQALEPLLFSRFDIQMHMPFMVSEYTDFYASRDHATNVGTMFRGAENALPPNWLHMPIGYNGRASSVVVSGTDIVRPWGQVKSPKHDYPAFQPTRRFDFELELGAVVGMSSDGPVSVQQADDMIFGYVLLNDWSARDVQGWEYAPLGPFQSKATATSISPWIVTKEALSPFRVRTPNRTHDLLPHLRDCGPMLYDIDLTATLTTISGTSDVITRTNYRNMYYASAQALAHHASSGCPMNTGDLLGSGTVSGPQRENRGCMLELCWGGQEPLSIGADGTESRCFLEDGDTITLNGVARGKGFSVGFGDCKGAILPALSDPIDP
jgi:fumarylacetoacetase